MIRSLTLDVAGTVYTNDMLLPAVQSAAQDLGMELTSRGYARVETTVDLDVAAGVGNLSSGSTPPLPTDFLVPQRMWEKTYGSTEKFVPMARAYELVDRDPGPVLGSWIWQDGEIRFLFNGATTNRSVRIEYIKTILPITSSGSSIDGIPGARNYLAYAALQLVGLGRGDSEMLSRAEKKTAEALERILNTYTSAEQYLAARRSPYGSLPDEDF